MKISCLCLTFRSGYQIVCVYFLDMAVGRLIPGFQVEQSDRLRFFLGKATK